MSLSWEQIQGKATLFSKKWREREGKEKQQAQMFVRDFLSCFGVDDPLKYGEFERPCKKEFGEDGFIDYFLPQNIIIEMKTKGQNLKKADKQVKDYILHLSADDMPPLIMVSDFEKIILTNRTSGKQKTFSLKDLYKHVRDFAHIAGYETSRTYDDELEVNILAAEKMAKLHDAIKLYGYEGHQLEVYLVRLLFCLFAEDTGIFPKGHFSNYIENSKKDGTDISMRIAKLFEVLNLSENARKKRILLSADLLQFRYINGGLFSEMLATPEFDAKMRQILIDCCNFDWDKISPAIFGSMFQGIMDAKQRRELGAHYTSEENILKLINALFLDDLWAEFDKVKADIKLLEKFHSKIASLIFLDPACGCGNFLIVTYRELRKLEIEILKMKASSSRKMLDLSLLLKVRVTQFYGIEYEEFPCQIAQVGMWLIDHQMNLRIAETFGEYYVRLPLTESATIKHANALTLDWQNVVAKDRLSYILGNPPFVGGMMMNKVQKQELKNIIGNIAGVGELDYVSAWYTKAAIFSKDTNIHVAFVATNSIVQGQQAIILWRLLFKIGVSISFAYKTFKWNNEAKGKAAVHCVITGFSFVSPPAKFIFDDGNKWLAKNINPYLINAPNIFIENRSKPLCNIPKMRFGSMPRDGGHFILTSEEKAEFVASHSLTEKWIKSYIGSYELINHKQRYCLWLLDALPNEIKQVKLVMERVEKVRQFRLNSVAGGTRKFAETPTLFCQIAQPNTSYIAIPKVSSERRHYIPIGFLTKDDIASDLLFLIPSATLYHFGILTSNVHNHWMRAVAGRLKSDYRYSKDIVYNNFPWPDTTDKQKEGIESLAKAVLDARDLFPESSLADLYDPLTMPTELRKAHQALDSAVMKLYGYTKSMNESDIVADLLQRYQQLTGN